MHLPIPAGTSLTANGRDELLCGSVLKRKREERVVTVTFESNSRRNKRGKSYHICTSHVPRASRTKP